MSVYPRIVFDKNIVDMYTTSDSLDGLLCRDALLVQTGTYFLDIIDSHNWLAVYESARSLYEEEKNLIVQDEQAFLKHVWFENYLFASKYADPSKERYIEEAEYL